MSNTLLDAEVEVAYSSIRGHTADTKIISSSKPGSLEISEPEGKLRLRAEVKNGGMGRSRYEGRAYIDLDRENAKTLCRNLAVRLGLTINE